MRGRPDLAPKGSVVAVRILAFRRIPLSRRSAWEKFYAPPFGVGKGFSRGFPGVFRPPPIVGVSSTDTP